MTLKEELQAKLNEEWLDRISFIEGDIRDNINDQYYSIELKLGVDVVEDWLGRPKFLTSGQAIWDKLVSLGFEPHYCVSSKWNKPYIWVSW